MVPPDSHRIPRVPWYLGVRSREPAVFTLQDCHLLWLAFPGHSVRWQVGNSPAGPHPDAIRSRNPGGTTHAGLHAAGLGSSRFARRYSGNRVCFLFLGVLRCFSSPGSPRLGYGFTQRCPAMKRDGFPHSGIPGLASVCDYPGLIAAYHALLRLPMPRHPPYTLGSLTPRKSTRCLDPAYRCQAFPIFSCQGATGIRQRCPREAGTRVANSMVEMSGLEPLTPCLQSRCSPS